MTPVSFRARADGLARPGAWRWYVPVCADNYTEAALGRSIDCAVNVPGHRMAARRNDELGPRGVSQAKPFAAGLPNVITAARFIRAAEPAGQGAQPAAVSGAERLPGVPAKSATVSA
jgi:hypothetical protein